MVDFVQIERLDRSPRSGMEEQDLYCGSRMAPILRVFPLETLERLAEMMNDIFLFFRTEVTGKDQDPPFASAWESALRWTAVDSHWHTTLCDGSLWLRNTSDTLGRDIAIGISGLTWFSIGSKARHQGIRFVGDRYTTQEFREPIAEILVLFRRTTRTLRVKLRHLLVQFDQAQSYRPPFGIVGRQDVVMSCA